MMRRCSPARYCGSGGRTQRRAKEGSAAGLVLAPEASRLLFGPSAGLPFSSDGFEAPGTGILAASLVVADNGRGFDPGKVTPEHLGLGIMRERAESVGAKLEIKSKAGVGTTVAIEWISENRSPG